MKLPTLMQHVFEIPWDQQWHDPFLHQPDDDWVRVPRSMARKLAALMVMFEATIDDDGDIIGDTYNHDSSVFWGQRTVVLTRSRYDDIEDEAFTKEQLDRFYQIELDDDGNPNVSEFTTYKRYGRMVHPGMDVNDPYNVNRTQLRLFWQAVEEKANGTVKKSQ